MALMGCDPTENRFQQEANHILSGTNSGGTNWFTRSVQGHPLPNRTSMSEEGTTTTIQWLDGKIEPIHLESEVRKLLACSGWLKLTQKGTVRNSMNELLLDPNGVELLMEVLP